MSKFKLSLLLFLLTSELIFFSKNNEILAQDTLVSVKLEKKKLVFQNENDLLLQSQIICGDYVDSVFSFRVCLVDKNDNNSYSDVDIDEIFIIRFKQDSLSSEVANVSNIQKDISNMSVTSGMLIMPIHKIDDENRNIYFRAFHKLNYPLNKQDLNKPIPNLTFETRRDPEMNIQDFILKGRHLVISFWNLSKRKYGNHIKTMKELNSRFQDRVDFIIFADSYIDDFPWLQGKMSKKIKNSFQEHGFPNTLIFDQYGELQRVIETPDDLENYLNKYL